MAKPDPFFDVPHPASITKARIVAKYFVAWAGIMARQHDKIAYLDLFSGPGAYADGTRSTPLLVMGPAAAEPLIASRLVSIFNDVNEDSAQKLEHALASVPGIDKLTYDPKIMNADVSDEVITELEDLQKMVPSLSFIDPYGYRGLTLNLIGRVVRDWGCEVIFFFNYQRINAAISNPKVRKHMEALFTAERLAELQTELASAKKDDRPDVIFQHLRGRLEELGGTYQRLTGEEPHSRWNRTQILDARRPPLVLNGDAHPDVLGPRKQLRELGGTLAALREDLEAMPVRRGHHVEDAADEIELDVLMEQVTHRVNEHRHGRDRRGGDPRPRRPARQGGDSNRGLAAVVAPFAVSAAQRDPCLPLPRAGTQYLASVGPHPGGHRRCRSCRHAVCSRNCRSRAIRAQRQPSLDGAPDGCPRPALDTGGALHTCRQRN